jgi:hypothetical protein
MSNASPEYQPPRERPWHELRAAEGELNRVLAELLTPPGQIGADLGDVARTTAIVHARALVAGVDALHGIRQELGRIAAQLERSAGDPVSK